jgi:hypothetical protein
MKLSTKHRATAKHKAVPRNKLVEQLGTRSSVSGATTQQADAPIT